jgi:hypothetical protein
MLCYHLLGPYCVVLSFTFIYLIMDHGFYNYVESGVKHHNPNPLCNYIKSGIKHHDPNPLYNYVD